MKVDNIQVDCESYTLAEAEKVLQQLNEKVFFENKIFGEITQSEHFPNQFKVSGYARCKGRVFSIHPDSKPPNSSIQDTSVLMPGRSSKESPNLRMTVYWRVGLIGAEDYYQTMPYILQFDITLQL